MADEYPPLDPNFLNQYKTEVEGPDGQVRQQFTLPAAREQRARYERPGLIGHLVQGARDVAPPTPWDPDKPKPELAADPNAFKTTLQRVRETTDPFTVARGAAALAGSVFGSNIQAPPQVPSNRPMTEDEAAAINEYDRKLGKLGVDTALNMIGVGKLPGASPGGAIGSGGGSAPTLRGKAADQAWRTGTAEERLRTSVHPYGGNIPLRDMPQPIIENAPNWTYKPVDIEKDLKNAELIFMQGDATGAGGRLMGFPGLKFENPVNRMGGNQYAQLMEHLRATGMTDDQIQRLWASMQGPMAGIFNIAKGVEQRGNVPWGVYMTGGKQYMDQSTQMVNTAIEAAKATGVSKKMNDHVVDVMRSDWNVPADKELLFPKTGLKNVSAVQRWLDLQPMPQHAKLVKAMGTAKAQDLGFPDIGMLRAGNTDPRLLTAQPGSAGLMLGRIDTSKGLVTPSHHPDYSTAIATDQLRTFGRQLPPEIIAKTMHEQRANQIRPLRPGQPSAYFNAPHLYYGAGGTAQKTEPVTNQWKDTVQNWLANNPEQKIGGVVLGAGANDARSVALASAIRNAPEVRTRTPQGTVNWQPEWMKRPGQYFHDMPSGVTFDPSLDMSQSARMARQEASPFKQEMYHFTHGILQPNRFDPNWKIPINKTEAPNLFSQFKNDTYGREFGTHAGSAGQAEHRGYALKAYKEGDDRYGGMTLKLAVDPGKKGWLDVPDMGTWGPISTGGALEQTQRFTSEELHKARQALSDPEILQNYRDLVRSKDYGGLQYTNQAEFAHGATKLAMEIDALKAKLPNVYGDAKYKLRDRIDNREYDLMQLKERAKEVLQDKSYAFPDPAQARLKDIAMFNPANYGNPFLLGAGANDARSVALAAGLNAARDPQLGSTVRNAAPIRAFHSSPHDFDKFDLSKVGTGEGAQVYGHGLYFAENPKVSGQGGQYWNQFKSRFAYNPAETEAISVLQNHDFNREKAIAELVDAKRYDAGYIGGATNSFDRAKREAIVAKNHEALRLLESGKPIGPRTYEVNIHARPEQLVNYDAPLSAQPAAAQDLLGRLNQYNIAKVGEGRWEVRHPGGWVPNAAKNFYRSEEAAQKAAEGLNIGRTVPDLIPRNAEQARPFVEAGIPGIRYLDEGSRRGGGEIDTMQRAYDNTLRRFNVGEKGVLESDVTNAKARLESSIARHGRSTSNYVIFDPGIIEIAKKYGIPGMLGAGAIGSTVAPDRYGRGS